MPVQYKLLRIISYSLKYVLLMIQKLDLGGSLIENSAALGLAVLVLVLAGVVFIDSFRLVLLGRGGMKVFPNGSSFEGEGSCSSPVHGVDGPSWTSEIQTKHIVNYNLVCGIKVKISFFGFGKIILNIKNTISID